MPVGGEEETPTTLRLVDVFRSRGTTWNISDRGECSTRCVKSIDVSKEYFQCQRDNVEPVPSMEGGQRKENGGPGPADVQKVQEKESGEVYEKKESGEVYEKKERSEVYEKKDEDGLHHGIPVEYDVDIEVRRRELVLEKVDEGVAQDSERKSDGFEYDALITQPSPGLGAMEWAKGLSPYKGKRERGEDASGVSAWEGGCHGRGAGDMEVVGTTNPISDTINPTTIKKKKIVHNGVEVDGGTQALDMTGCDSTRHGAASVTLFTSASGKSIHISKDKIKAAKCLLEMPLEDMVDTHQQLHVHDPNSSEIANPAGLNAGFVTGLGSKVEVSKEKLEIAARLFSDIDVDTKPKIHYGTQNNAKYAMDAEDRNDTKGKEKDEELLFTTGLGSAVDVPQEKMEVAARLFRDIDVPTHDSPRLNHKTPRAVDKMVRNNMFSTPTPVRTQNKVDASGVRSRLGTSSLHHKSTTFISPKISHKQFHAEYTTKDQARQHSDVPGKLASNTMEASPDESSLRKRILEVESLVQSGQVQCIAVNEWKYKLPLTPEKASVFVFPEARGPGDVRARMLASGAKAEVVSEEWIRNHYKWVVWKLALIEFALGPRAAGKIVDLDIVEQEVRQRYHLEYTMGKSSLLKRILQRDTPSTVPCVLKVAHICADPTRQGKQALQLTDGWYSITAACDDMLSNLICLGKIHPGIKLRICGAELIAGEPGSPLEAAKSSIIKLTYNQVHMSHSRAKLGRLTSGIPVTPLSIIRPSGIVPRMMAKILVVFPPLVWSKLPSGVSTFQTAKAATVSDRALDSELSQAQNKAFEDIQQKEIEMCQSWLKHGKPGGMTKVDRLYATMVISDDTEFVSGLNQSDKEELEKYVQQRRLEIQNLQSEAMKRILEEEIPAANCASSIPTQTFLIGEVAQTEHSSLQGTALLTAWRPSEEIAQAKVSDVLDLTLVQCSMVDGGANRYQGPYLSSLLQLQTTKSSLCVVRPKTSRLHSCISYSKTEATIMDMHRMVSSTQQPGSHKAALLDITGIIIKSGPVYVSTDYKSHYQWIFMLDASQSASNSDTPWLLGLQVCGPEHAIQWLHSNMDGKMARFENVECVGIDPTFKVVRAMGSMATKLILGPSLLTQGISLQEWYENNKDFVLKQVERVQLLMMK